MNYPDEFNTPTFPAGPRIASSRAVSVAIMVVFFLIMCACGFLLWAQRSVQVHPFLVSVNNITGQWDIVGHQHNRTREITTTQSLQESVIGKFLTSWFWISGNERLNAALWKRCDYAADCNPESQTSNETGPVACSLYCLTGGGIFSRFTSDVMPDYERRAASGETWMVDMSTVQFVPLGTIGANGGSWQIRATIMSNLSEPINILAYAQVSRNTETYPQTLGYYISDFNAYKMN